MSKEIRDIRLALQAAWTEGKRCALATVVRAEGSSYRKTGARMLVTSDGCIIAGCVSAGCLESDVAERACEAMAVGRASLVTYDTRLDESEILFGWGTGCSGLIELLIEPLHEENAPLALPTYADEHRKPCVLLTFYGQDLTDPGRVLLDDEGRIVERIGTDAVDGTLVSMAQDAFRNERSQAVRVGALRTCIEYLAPTRNLILYGTGPDAVALAGMAQTLGWAVTIADHRAIPSALGTSLGRLISCRPESLLDQVTIDSQTALVLMSHNYLVDRELLCAVADTSLRYVGLLGSRVRYERLREDLTRSGDGGKLALLSGRLHAPVGLDLGASTPQTIALSIVAEIEGFFAKEPAGQSES